MKSFTKHLHRLGLDSEKFSRASDSTSFCRWDFTDVKSPYRNRYAGLASFVIPLQIRLIGYEEIFHEFRHLRVEILLEISHSPMRWGEIVSRRIYGGALRPGSVIMN